MVIFRELRGHVDNWPDLRTYQDYSMEIEVQLPTQGTNFALDEDEISRTDVARANKLRLTQTVLTVPERVEGLLQS